MRPGGGQWSDLAARLGSAAAMAVIGLAGILAGGHVFHGMVAVICGAMVWELVRMLAPDAPGPARHLGGLAGAATLLAIYVPAPFALPVLLAPSLVGLGQLRQLRFIFVVFAALVLLAGFSMMLLRDMLGLGWLLWLVSVVIASDVAGYFAGRLIGGPKFWPRISPKKTWSGTVFGWIGAAIVGACFAPYLGAPVLLVWLSVAVALAAQMGDIAESAIKRRQGVKDSSALIPGHGGLLDRFDGMLGASVFVLLIAPFVDFLHVLG